MKRLFSRPSPGTPSIEGLLPEPMFVQALRIERKRAERSRKLFVLMVVDHASPIVTKGLLRRCAPALLSSIRETDVAGWHQDQAALGVIFAEFGSADANTVIGALRAKVTSALQSRLSAKEYAGLRVTFHVFPEDWNDAKKGLPIEKLYPDLLKRERARRVPRTIKRGIDILGSAMALLLLSPVLLGIALAIRATSRGPILFRQKRIGQYGVPFTCLKFRSMYDGNDPRIHMEYVRQFIAGHRDGAGANGAETNGKVYKITKDPRLTRVGQFLRRTSLDELPQFINVLRGDMSMVGPRPPIPYELEAYDIWHRRRLLEVKPGITGLWQVNGRSRLPFDEMVRLDLRYATTWSVWLDLKILMRTPQAVFSGAGAY